MTPRLKELYKKEVLPRLKEELNYKNSLAIPRLEKIVINRGIGEGSANPKILDLAIVELTSIAGQSAIKRKAKKSVAGFKLREGMAIGCMVTLRKNKMYEFLDRLINIALPRVRDFRGLSPNSFDGYGNYTFGLQEQLLFPEINYDKIEKLRGMSITIVTTAKTDKEAKLLLTHLGMPFSRG